MKYHRTKRFKEALKKLPKEIQDKIPKAFELIQEDYRHPSLQTKKIQGRDSIWEGRIDQFYRFTFEFTEDEDGETICLFRNIGRHEIIEHNP